MDIKYPIENEFIKCMLQINGFSGSRPRVQSSHRVELGGGGGGGGGGVTTLPIALALLYHHSFQALH